MGDSGTTTFFIIWMLLTFSVSGQQSGNFQYINPKPYSRYVSPESNIIIKEGNIIEGATVNEKLIKVYGSESGIHKGHFLLSDDSKTLVFNPYSPFSQREKVTVELNEGIRAIDGKNIGKLDFEFFINRNSEPGDVKILNKELDNDLQVKDPEKRSLASILANIPSLRVDSINNPSAGYLFFAPSPYLMIIDNDATPVFYRNVNGSIYDFKLQPTGEITYFIYSPLACYALDSSLDLKRTLKTANGYSINVHDLRVFPNGHYYILGKKLVDVDMSKIVEGGDSNAQVIDMALQEFDSTGNVVFQWSALDNYQIIDADDHVPLTQHQIDFVHFNSIEIDTDSNIILSARNLDEITKINHNTGEIIWRLGGENDQFTFINDERGFSRQHDIRRLSNGNITIFDNGSSQFGRTYSRAVEYQIDETQKTATKVWEYRPSPDIFVPTMGNIQRLPNGNSLICWGFASMNGGLAATEVDPDGNKLMDVTFSENGWTTYRAFRFPYNGGRPAVKVVIYEVQESNDYEFVEGDKSIGVSMTITYKPGSGYNEVHGYYYQTAPFEPQFPELAPVVLPQRFVMDRFAIDQMQADLDFDVAYFNLENPESITVYHREFEGRGMFFPLNTTYNPVTGKIRASMRKFGEFIFVREVTQPEMQPPILAFPENGSRVNQTLPLELAWSARGYAIYFDLQVARDSLFTQLVLDESDLMEQSYTMESLDATVYYWRVRASTDFDTSAWAMARFDAVAPFLQVTSPAAGEELTVGLRHFIEWEDNLDEDILVELYLQDTPVAVLDTVETVKAYYWDVPFQMELGDLYRIRISSVSSPELFDFSDYFTLTDNAEPPPPEVEAYHLYHCQPNPVLTETLVRYDLPVESRVKLEVFDVLGRRVAVLIDGWIGKGPRSVQWKPRIGQGIYYIRLKAAPLESDEFSSYEKVRKAVVLK